MCGQILGLIFGATTWLRNLIIGESAPLRVIQDSVKLLGWVSTLFYVSYSVMLLCFVVKKTDPGYVTRRDGTIPCITLILGGNLTQG